MEVNTLSKFQKLSGSEMEIMRVIWELATPVTSTQIQSIFENKGWKPQTISTFLTRMVEKGFLCPSKRGRTNSYASIYTEQSYRRMEAKSLIDNTYDGSVQDFLATLYSGKEIDSKEIEALKRWFDEVTKDD